MRVWIDSKHLTPLPIVAHSQAKNRCYLDSKSHGMGNPLVGKHLNKDYYALKLIYLEQ